MRSNGCVSLKMKVIWDQLIEAAITLQIFNQNLTDQPSMKRRIFLLCLFYCFFRLPIYESIAAIFWQSASYFPKFFKIHQSERTLINSLRAIFKSFYVGVDSFNYVFPENWKISHNTPLGKDDPKTALKTTDLWAFFTKILWLGSKLPITIIGYFNAVDLNCVKALHKVVLTKNLNYLFGLE